MKMAERVVAVVMTCVAAVTHSEVWMRLMRC